MSTRAGPLVDSTYTAITTNPRKLCWCVNMAKTKGGKQELSRQVGSRISVYKKSIMIINIIIIIVGV